jgi:5'-nucleotidase
MKILYIDMDGVVADFDRFVQPLIPDVILGDGDPSTYDERSARVDKVMRDNPFMFELLPEIEGAIDAVELLKKSEKYDIYFLSTPVFKVPQSYGSKRYWIEEHFGEWADKRLILTHRKDLCIGDYLVDDRFKNGADKFQGEHIHFGSQKFPDWKTVIKYLL